MRLLQKRLPLFICLLLFLSTAKANNSSRQDSFEFLKTPFENATVVEDGLTLTKNTVELYFSEVINTGILWALCKAPVFIYGMASKPQFTDIEKQELKPTKSDFCLQLAPLATTAETILAGQVSPWPIATLWWRPVFLISAGLATYNSITSFQMQATPQKVATVALAYLAAEGLSRTTGSDISAIILNKIGKTSINDNDYHIAQYSTLAIFTGFIAASVTYEMLLHKGVRSARARFASVISAMAASALSEAIPTHNALYNAGFNIRDYTGFIAGVGAITGALVGAAFGAAALTNRVPASSAELGTLSVILSGTLAGAGVGAVSGTVPSAGAVAGLGAMAGVGAGAIVGALAGSFSIMAVNVLAPNNYPLKVIGTAAIATSLAILNSLSGFAVYGHPLEQSLSETTQTLWNKFLAPLDYIATLFPQLLSQHELEE